VAKKTKPKPKAKQNDKSAVTGGSLLSRQKAAVEELQKKYGSGTLQIGRSSYVNVESIPTELLNLDLALGCCGLPRGRIIELFGGESSGKTTLCLRMIASCQSRGGTAAFVDAEHALDPVWAASNGVNIDKLLISQPNSGESALDVVSVLLKHGVCDLIVVDSVAALVPQAELDGELDDKTIGAHARLMSKAMRSLAGRAYKAKAVVLFINQMRDKIGFVLGATEGTTGGRALKFYSSVRMEIKKVNVLRVNDSSPVYGIVSRIKIVKNKVAPPFRQVMCNLHHGANGRYGFDKVHSAIEGGKDSGIITIRGSNYYFGVEKIGNGLKAVEDKLLADQDLLAAIMKAVYDNSKEKLAELATPDVAPGEDPVIDLDDVSVTDDEDPSDEPDDEESEKDSNNEELDGEESGDDAAKDTMHEMTSAGFDNGE